VTAQPSTQVAPTALGTTAMQQPQQQPQPPSWGTPAMQQPQQQQQQPSWGTPAMQQPQQQQQPAWVAQTPTTQQPQQHLGGWSSSPQQVAMTGGFGGMAGGGNGGFAQQPPMGQMMAYGQGGFSGAAGGGGGGMQAMSPMGGRPRWIVDVPTPVSVDNPQQLVGMRVTMQKRSFHPNPERPPVEDYVLVSAYGNLPVFLHKDTSDQIKSTLGPGAPLPQYVSGTVSAIRAEVAKPRCRYELQPGTTMYFVQLTL